MPAVKSEVVHCYVQLAENVALMADLARSKKWGELPALETKCAAYVERLKVMPGVETLEPSDMAETRRLISRIRADQDVVFGLVRPQFEQLIERMGSISRQRDLGKAYGMAH